LRSPLLLQRCRGEQCCRRFQLRYLYFCTSNASKLRSKNLSASSIVRSVCARERSLVNFCRRALSADTGPASARMRPAEKHVCTSKASKLSSKSRERSLVNFLRRALSAATGPASARMRSAEKQGCTSKAEGFVGTRGFDVRKSNPRVLVALRMLIIGRSTLGCCHMSWSPRD
jgi:hypothetical protein